MMLLAFPLLVSSVAVLGDPGLPCAKGNVKHNPAFWTGDPLESDGNPETTSQSLNKEACPGGPKWRRFEDKCYYASTSERQPGRTWHVAEAYCRQHRGHLASVHSEEEDLFIRRLFRKDIPALRIWIGLNKLRIDKQYRWSDNSLMTYSNWQPGEPNDSYGAEHCTHVYNNTGTWNDMNCARLLPFACEQSYNGDPPPTFMPPPSTSGKCPQNFTKVGAKCFYAETNELFTFKEAEQQCKAKDSSASLATVSSPTEQSFLQGLVINSSRTSSYWIGMTWTYCDFQWRNGQPVTFTNWAKNATSGGTASPCVVMYGDSSWHDVECEGSRRGYLCEAPTNTSAGESQGDFNSTSRGNSTLTLDYVLRDSPSDDKRRLLLEVVLVSVGAVIIITLAVVGAVLFCRRRKLSGPGGRGIENQVFFQRDDTEDVEMSFEMEGTDSSK